MIQRIVENSNFNKLRVIFLLMALTFIYLTGNNFYSNSSGDGFLSSIYLFQNNPWSEIDYELKFVHLIRYLVSSPFVYRNEIGLPPFFDSIIFCLIASLFIEKESDFALYFVPCFFSYRTGLCMISLYGAWTILKSNKPSFWRFIITFLFSILSSGVLMNWFIMLLWFSYFDKKFKTPIILFFIAASVAVLSLSVIHKFDFFLKESQVHHVKEDANISTEDLFEADVPSTRMAVRDVPSTRVAVRDVPSTRVAVRDVPSTRMAVRDVPSTDTMSVINILSNIKRSTIIDSIISKKAPKVVFFILILFFYLFSCVYLTGHLPRWEKIWLYTSLFNFTVEGLSAVSFLFIFISLLYFNFKERIQKRAQY